jgi:predicted membrane channel-forming protein YqfA (hemolysin III family)
LLGLLTVLVGLFSDADLSGRVVTFVAGVLLVAGVLIYGVVANRSLAEPTPGSSLSAESTSSFTL